MNEERWERAKRIFAASVSVEGDACEQLLRRECGDDAELRADVEALLEARSAGDVVSGRGGSTRVGGADRDVTVVAAATEGPGTCIGPYKLLQLIGEGGFGSVFMAEQEAPVRRVVAFKIIKLGMDTRQVIARFEAERQALAMMDHPNIARVFDAGTTDSGRPFFVMELCKGDPIVEYCDKNSLSIPERLELFAQVCHAVQHAHMKGIIHRDIKPSNVLVSTLDGGPSAKVIDFGVAKATASKLTEKTLFTEHRQLIGTPEYMSPEQAEGSLDIDTRTDVYSLGVLLYELLTGTTPFSSQQLRSAAYAEIQRIIREIEPPKPSTRLSQSTDTLASVSAKRHVEPRRLRVIVRGELDWIVMKALEKDRARRYETANGLALDVGRYLRGEAVVAAPPSRAYRLAKFVRRNRVVVTATFLIAVALTLGILGASIGIVWALRERDRATQEASRARVMNNFMQGMVIAANPELSRGGGITVAEMLKHASEKADRTLRGEPIAEGEARTFLASTFRAIGRIEEAEKEARRGLELRESGIERNTLHHAESLRVLAMIMGSLGNYADAERGYRQALAILQALDPIPAFELCGAHNDLARGLHRVSKFAEAEEVLDRGEAIMDRLIPGNKNVRANYLSTRALIALDADGDTAKAESLQVREIELRRELPEQHLLADALNGLAIMKMRQGDTDAALKLYQECLGIQRNLFSGANQTVAILIENMANAYFMRKEYDQAITQLEEVLAIRTEIYGEDGFPVARTRYNMGVLASEMGDHARGLELVDGALVVFRKHLGDNHIEVGQLLRGRATCLKGLGNLDEALRDARSALAILDAAGIPTSRGRLRALSLVVELLCLQGSTAEAERLVGEAVGQLDPQIADQADWVKTLNEKLEACGAG